MAHSFYLSRLVCSLHFVQECQNFPTLVYSKMAQKKWISKCAGDAFFVVFVVFIFSSFGVPVWGRQNGVTQIFGLAYNHPWMLTTLGCPF